MEEARTQYVLRLIRLSKGIEIDEESFATEQEALARLDELGLDADCLLAEVEDYSDGTKLRVGPTAQADRLSGKWRRVQGELRFRARADEVHAILRDANQSDV